MCFPSSLIFRYVVINRNPRIVCFNYSIWLTCAGRPKMFTTSSETYADTLWRFTNEGIKPPLSLPLVWCTVLLSPIR